MADDWQVGDLALCVREPEGTYPTAWVPCLGGVYVVAEYRIVFGDDFLELEEDPFKFTPDIGWEPRCFRKIRPLTDEERNSFLADLPEPVAA